MQFQEELPKNSQGESSNCLMESQEQFKKKSFVGIFAAIPEKIQEIPGRISAGF